MSNRLLPRTIYSHDTYGQGASCMYYFMGTRINQVSMNHSTASASSPLGSLAHRATLIHRAGGLARSIGVEVVEGLINNLPRDVNVTGEACIAVELTQDGVAEVQSRGAVGVPDSVGTGARAASLASVANEQREVRLDAIDSDHNPLAAVLCQVSRNLCVVHSNQIVAIDLIERKASREVAFNKAEVLVGKAGTTSLNLLDIVVVGSEASSAVNNSLSESRSGKDANRSKELTFHFDEGVFQRSVVTSRGY